MKLKEKLFFWHNHHYIQDEFNNILAKAQKYGFVDSSSKEMIENILMFTHTLVREIMIPRTEITAVSTETNIEEVIKEVITSRHTRLPVYRGTIDNIVGILNVKDLFNFWSMPITKENILASLLKPYYIPETKSTHLLFYELKEKKQHIAIVIDEYGGTSGLVTLEDLLEEIVGEIHDEHEINSSIESMYQITDGSIVIDGRTEIEKIEEFLNIGLDKGRYETIAGLILHFTKRIPLNGEKFLIEGLEILIENADERSIKKVRVKKLSSNDHDAD